MNDWQTTTIKKSSYLKGRIGWQGLRASEFIEEGAFLITGTDFCNGNIDWSNCYHVSEQRYREASYIHVRDNDLLITKDGTIGKVALVKNCPAKAVLNSGIFLLRSKDGSYDHHYAYFVLTSEIFERFLRLNLNGSTINHLYQYVFESFELPIPHLKVQKKIAKILQTIDRTIARTEALIEKYQQIKAGLMHDLFTRGIGADGKLRPPREVAPELYKNSAIGWIPKEWEVEILDRLTHRGSGHTPNKSIDSYWNGGLKWVSLADSRKLDNLYIFDTDLEISELGIQNSSAVIHPKGTVIMTRDAGVGKSAIISEPMAVSQHFMAWRCGEGMNNYFLYYWLQHKKRMFENVAMGSTIVTIGLPYFKKLKIAAPISKTEQEKIGEKLRFTDTHIFSLKSDCEKLKYKKYGLMHDLLTGKVSVNVDSDAA